MKVPICSINIADVSGMPLIREQNVSPTGIDTVEDLPKNYIKFTAIIKQSLH